jgi:hypothetical protein
MHNREQYSPIVARPGNAYVAEAKRQLFGRHQNPDADLRAEMRRPQPAGYWDDVRVQVNDKARVASLLLEHAKNPVLGL